MQDVSKDDFLQWKESEITKLLFRRTEETIQQFKDILGDQAGLNSVHDAQMVAMIRAYRNVLEVTFEELVSEQA